MKQGKEGMMVAAKKGTFKLIDEVTQSDLRSILTVRIGYHNVTVRIVLVYAPQEGDPLEDRIDFFEEIAIQIERSETAGDMLVLLGDFNARINYEEGQVKPASPNGKLIYELLDDYNLKLGNLSPSTVGEWTRIQKIKNYIHKSRIDYVVLHEDTLPLMEKMIIDEEKIHCPYRERKTKNGKNITFADHCPILLSLQVRASCHHVPTSSRKVWNFSDDGYVHYKEHSKHPMKVTWNACTTTQIFFP